MPTPTLDRFDASRKCVKCGSRNISSIWERGDIHYWDGSACDLEHEHIHRYCRRCGYSWIELPLDAQGDDA